MTEKPIADFFGVSSDLRHIISRPLLQAFELAVERCKESLQILYADDVAVVLRLEQINLVLDVACIIVNRCCRDQHDLFAVANLMQLAEAVGACISETMRFIHKNIFVFRAAFQMDSMLPDE